MARLIDADALKKTVEDFPNCYNGWSDTYDKAFIIGAIEEAPTIDAVSVVHGEWIKHKERTEINGKFIDFFPAEYECSNCGLREAHYFINSKPHNYCPNCGAQMKGADDEID